MGCPSTHLSLSFVGLAHFTYTSIPPPLFIHRCCYFCYLHNTTSLIFYTHRITSRRWVKYIYRSCRNNTPTQFTCGRAIVSITATEPSSSYSTSLSSEIAGASWATMLLSVPSVSPQTTTISKSHASSLILSSALPPVKIERLLRRSAMVHM